MRRIVKIKVDKKEMNGVVSEVNGGTEVRKGLRKTKTSRGFS